MVEGCDLHEGVDIGAAFRWRRQTALELELLDVSARPAVASLAQMGKLKSLASGHSG